MADHRPLAKGDLDQQQNIKNQVLINGNENGLTNSAKNYQNNEKNFNKSTKTVSDEQFIKSRKRDRRRRPHKYENNKITDNSNDFSSMPHANSNQYCNFAEKQIDDQALFQNQNTKPIPKSTSLTEHQLSLKTFKSSVPSTSSTSSSSKSIDKKFGSEEYVHTVCGGISKKTHRKKMDMINTNSQKAPNENRSFKTNYNNHKTEAHSFGKSDSNRNDFKISSSLPNSAMNIMPINQSIIHGNQKMKEYHRSNNESTNQMEPLMSININENKKKQHNEQTAHYDQSNNGNPNNKISDNQLQQDGNLTKIEQEFEKNYVFKMKKSMKNNEQAKYLCEICNYYCNSVDFMSKHIAGPIHKTNFETMRLELKIRDLEMPSDSRLEILSGQLVDFYNKNIITKEHLKYRFDVFYEFKQKFLTKYPTAKVNMYGSMAYGICSNDSVCDIDIDFANDSKSNSQILKDVLELIKNEMSEIFEPSQFKQINSTNGKKSQSSQTSNKLTAIAKKLPQSKEKIIFNFTSGLFVTAYKTSTLIKAYFELDERVKILAFVFRYIAKLTQIDKVDLCTLPPHAYILMVIFFLQKLNPCILPVLHETINSKKILTNTSKSRSSGHSTNQKAVDNASAEKSNVFFYNDESQNETDDDDDEEEDLVEDFEIFKKNLQTYVKNHEWKIKNEDKLGSLWLKLLAFYSLDFGFKKNFISIRSLDRVSKSEVKMYTKKIAIEDPFLLKQSLSRNLMTQTNKHIIFVISRTCLYFINYTNGFRSDEIENRKGEKIVGKLISDTGLHEANKKNKDFISNGESLEENGNELSDNDINNQEIEEDIFDLDYANSNEYDENARKENFEKKLCEEIDQKLSMISVLDTMLTASAFSSCSSRSDSDENFQKSEESSKIGAVKSCMDSLLDKVVGWYESVYDEMPRITLKTSSDDKNLIDDNNDSFKLTLSSLNLPKGPPKVCSLCVKEGHLEKECPQDCLPELEPLPEITTNWIEILDSICKHIKDENQQSKKEENIRIALLQKISEIVQKRFPEAKLSLFGSSNNGFGMKKSDLDICLTLDNHPSGEKLVFKKIIRMIGWLFRREQEFDMVEERINAKVPIVKFRHKKTDIEGDISLYNTLALQNTNLLRSYAEIDNRTKILGHVVKYFAKTCRIGDASCGSLSSYAYIIMVIHYLMNTKTPVLPCLQKLNKENFSRKETNLNIDGWDCWFNKDIESLSKTWPHYKQNTESIGSLWLGFLRYYTEVFDWEENVVSIRSTDPLTRRSKSWTKHRLAIEDPFELTHNLAAGVSHKMGLYILKSFAKARFLFGNVIHDFRTEEIRLNIEYFFNPKSLVDGILPVGRNCFTCLKIGHQTKDCPIANNNRKDRNRRIYSESHDEAPIVCYRCRKTGHMARDCQEVFNGNNEKRQNKQIPIKSMITSSNSNHNQKIPVNNYANERCFTCNNFGHLSRDCKNQVTITSKNHNQQQQQQFIRQGHSMNHQQHQQSAPAPKIIRIEHIQQTRHVNPPILIQSGDEKYHILVKKNSSSPNQESLNKKSDLQQQHQTQQQQRHNVIANYQNFFQSQQQSNIQNYQIPIRKNSQSSTLNNNNGNDN